MYRKTSLLIAVLVVTAPLFAAEDVLKWNKSPEAYFMTAEERAQFAKIASPEDAAKFIDEFRRKRGEQFAKDVRTRFDIADKEFKLDKTPGSLTARGRVFILLGPPSRATTNRDVADSRMLQGVAASSAALENKALMETEWTYDADRLPPELGMKRLVVKFQTDSRRGIESIENPGFVEPYLTRAATHISNKYIAATTTASAPRNAVASGPVETTMITAPDPLWNASPALNGAIFTGESFLSPREEPFYAYSFYLEKSTPAFSDWKSVLLVSLVRDASGAQIVSERQQVDLSAYDDGGNRYIDHSLSLSPGKYEGLFALYTPDGATLLSSHRATFEVAAKDAPRASALFLTSRVDTLETQQAFDPFTFVAQKYAVRGDRRFRATDKVSFFTIVANPNGSPEPKLMQKMTFTRDGKDFARTPLEPAQVTQTGPNTFLVGTMFDPNTFPAGQYKLELQIRDMNAPDGSELRTKGYVLASDFRIE